MIKASISKINNKKSRYLLFLTLGLAEYPNGLAESSLLVESTMGLAEFIRQNDKIRILQESNKQPMHQFTFPKVTRIGKF